MRLNEDSYLAGFTPLMANPQKPCYAPENCDMVIDSSSINPPGRALPLMIKLIAFCPTRNFFNTVHLIQRVFNFDLIQQFSEIEENLT